MSNLQRDRVPLKYRLGLWLTAGSFAFVFCLYHFSATLVDGAFLPADYDSFYHARRIVDSLGDPLRMYQFDARIHAPEGSWVTWPWAYDALLAWIAKALMALTGTTAPLSVLAFVAPAWVFVNAALFLGIASRLRLSLPMQVLAMLFFTLFPLLRNLHRVGMLDHHYMEYSFVLATVYFGLGWFEDLASRRRAIALGVVLGAAPAFHNGLFILQLPVLLTVGCLWLAARPLDRRGMLTFALALVATTTAFLLPSEPFRNGEFSYYLHSGFHLYVAFCTGLVCALASVVRFTPKTAAGVVVLLALLAAPMLPQLMHGGNFVLTRLPYLDRIAELSSIRRALAEGDWWKLTVSYTVYLWLLPLGVGWLLWRLRRDSSNARVFFAVEAVFGSLLLLQSFRMHYFGSFALILPLCVLIDDLRQLRPAIFATRLRRLALGTLLVAPLLVGLAQLLYVYPLGGTKNYSLGRPLYFALVDVCRRAPGVVLAEGNDGHPIYYHTDCSVIANNFLTTPQHVERFAFTEALFSASSAEVLERAPYVRYILVKRIDDVTDFVRKCGLECPENDGLRRELLADGAPVPKRLRLLREFRVNREGKSEPFARLFEVLPAQ